MSEPIRSPAATPDVWFQYASDDLHVAEQVFADVVPVYHLTCFLSQGAAEKYLKGYLIAQGWKLEKVHDILRLLKRCQPFDAELAGMIAEGTILNEYITAGRYPGDIGVASLGKTEAEEALAAARRIRDRVLELMRK